MIFALWIMTIGSRSNIPWALGTDCLKGDRVPGKSSVLIRAQIPWGETAGIFFHPNVLRKSNKQIAFRWM